MQDNYGERMKALLSTAKGGPETLKVMDLPAPTPGDNQVVISVRAVGINYPDVLIIEDNYQYKPERPFAPGGEVSGVISAVGSQVTSLKAGDRVLAYTGWGGLVEQIAVDEHLCLPLPDDMPWDEAAALIFTYGTSWYALRNRGQLRAGEKVLVLGAAGGVGLSAVELASALGAEVIAACSSQEKIDLCLKKGATSGILYPAGELDQAAQRAFSADIKRISGGGVDMVVDAVGGNYANPALRTLNWEGRYLVIGFTAGVPAIPLNLPLLKSCDIRGVFWGAWLEKYPEEFRQSIRELFELYGRGAIRPAISRVYPLAEAPEAINELRERRAAGKLVVTID